MPLLRILVLVFALVHAGGAGSVRTELACAETCEDGGGEDCPPACPTCHGPTRTPIGVTATTTTVPAAGHRAVVGAAAYRERAPAAPDPHEILHVPITRAG